MSRFGIGSKQCVPIGYGGCETMLSNHCVKAPLCLERLTCSCIGIHQSTERIGSRSLAMFE